ncbi:Os08g0206150 [Oryza sativa Japonica Group]|uniref:Os08g0206150 protein n=1 Tax=Oryza sativa subsp. japonica TaxID=39947 RepID=A0A0P0XD13_ORYSJ|nr:Os08g0206150 [Oryza sativa Japonica Group]
MEAKTSRPGHQWWSMVGQRLSLTGALLGIPPGCGCAMVEEKAIRHITGRRGRGMRRRRQHKGEATASPDALCANPSVLLEVRPCWIDDRQRQIEERPPSWRFFPPRIHHPHRLQLLPYRRREARGGGRGVIELVVIAQSMRRQRWTRQGKYGGGRDGATRWGACRGRRCGDEAPWQMVGGDKPWTTSASCGTSTSRLFP